MFLLFMLHENVDDDKPIVRIESARFAGLDVETS